MAEVVHMCSFWSTCTHRLSPPVSAILAPLRMHPMSIFGSAIGCWAPNTWHASSLDSARMGAEPSDEGFLYWLHGTSVPRKRRICERMSHVASTTTLEYTSTML